MLLAAFRSNNAFNGAESEEVLSLFLLGAYKLNLP
jgi:hypothetical protein